MNICVCGGSAAISSYNFAMRCVPVVSLVGAPDAASTVVVAAVHVDMSDRCARFSASSKKPGPPYSVHTIGCVAPSAASRRRMCSTRGTIVYTSA